MTRKLRLCVLLICGSLLEQPSSADEGMWLFNHLPEARLASRYHFAATQQWYDHLRLASVRFNASGSGSIVSADGLVLTNQHVARNCLENISSAAHDYDAEGFYAGTMGAEPKCPDLELVALQEITDVTARVRAAAAQATDDKQRATLISSARAQVESDCVQRTGLRCEVIELYSGGMYHLYQYKRYRDVRLVFTPEESIASFGGDPDNFEFPRYDLDVAFVRLYENGLPAHTPEYLRWTHSGIREGELVFVSGHPNNTNRLLVTAQLEFLRDVQHPFLLERHSRLLQSLQAFASRSAEHERSARRSMLALENSIKSYRGEISGLRDPRLMNAKGTAEARLQAAVRADPKLQKQYGDLWSAISASVVRQRELYLPYTFAEGLFGFSGRMAQTARTLVRVAAESRKPSGERLPEYADSRLPILEQRLFASVPIPRALEEVLLCESLKLMQEKLGAEAEIVRAALHGESPELVAHRVISGTRLDDAAFRKRLYEGGAEMIASSTDPLITLLRDTDGAARKIRTRWEEEVARPMTQGSARLARLRFAVEGAASYPDASGTLRLAFGTVKGYVEDGQGIERKGTHIAPFTRLGGIFSRSSQHGSAEPFRLPQSWIGARERLKLDTPFNFVSTADISGGNSGSPAVDRRGEIVGVIFDMNVQSLPTDFQYDDRMSRSLSVDARGILECLRTVYHAKALASELWEGARHSE